MEKLTLLVAAATRGTILHSEIINSAVKMKCFLSGMPELKLGPNDKLKPPLISMFFLLPGIK